MKKQTTLLLSTLVLLTAVSMQPANAFGFKFLAKKEKPVVVTPVKKEVKTEVVEEQDVKKVETKVEKKLEAAKPAVKPACPCKKTAAKPVVKTPVKPVVKPACPCKAVVKTPVKPVVKAPTKK